MPVAEKRISAAVGRGGTNLGNDVRVIKFLLNSVPETSGGPLGVILERTSINELSQHIQHFQASNGLTADGRVDVEGRTLRLLRRFDPTPEEPPFVPNVFSGKKRLGTKKG